MEGIAATAILCNGKKIPVILAVNENTWILEITSMSGETVGSLIAQCIAEVEYDWSNMTRKTIAVIESQVRGIWVLTSFGEKVMWMKYTTAHFRTTVERLGNEAKLLAEPWLSRNLKGCSQND